MEPLPSIPPEGVDRRPIQTRSAWWAQALSRRLVALGLTPNQISVASVVWAALGAALITAAGLGWQPVASWVGAAVCIQLRLLCNMLDGLMAVEGGCPSPTGELYNEVPDRLADVLFLVSAGYASGGGEWGVALGWAAAVLAVHTAYVRAMGARRGWPQDFSGPMAKPHRMALLTVACLTAAAEAVLGWQPRAILIALALIAAGAVATSWRRLAHLGRRLRTSSPPPAASP